MSRFANLDMNRAQSASKTASVANYYSTVFARFMPAITARHQVWAGDFPDMDVDDADEEATPVAADGDYSSWLSEVLGRSMDPETESEDPHMPWMFDSPPRPDIPALTQQIRSSSTPMRHDTRHHSSSSHGSSAACRNVSPSSSLSLRLCD